jgi:adenylate cyclase
MNKVSFFKIHRLRILLSILIVLIFLFNTFGVLSLDFLQRLEKYTYDVKLQQTTLNTIDKRIVIVDVDEKSLQEQGHWPWSRNKLAQMVDVLFDKYNIDVLGFDILFAERDESSGLKRLETLSNNELQGNAAFRTELDKLKPQLNYDQIFADSLKNRRVSLGYYFRHDAQQGGNVGTLPAPVLAQDSFDPRDVGARVASGYAANLPELQQSAAAGGYFSASPLISSDGVFRRIPLLQIYDGAMYESLGIVVAKLALRESKIDLLYEGGQKNALSLENIGIGPRRIPVDIDFGALIPYRGKQGSFPYVSASDVLNGKVSPEILKGAIVLVGTTAPGLLDARTTPLQEAYAGVEAHANMVAGILDGTIKARPPYSIGLEFVLLLMVGVMLALTLPALNPLFALLFSFVTMAVVTALNMYAWQYSNLVLPLASILVLVTFLFIFNMSFGFFVESRGKRSLAKLFGQYVPPELVDEMAKDPGAYSLEGESREMTVLFTDVRGFTTISEGLDPKQLTKLMNEFLTPMTHVIHKHRGTIDKYMGDAIMSFWGAPLNDAEHAKNALKAALDMIASLEALQDQFKANGWPKIKIGVGLNTGEMTVGNMGSEFRLAYTVMGDAVNLGSRLEGLTKEYGVQIIVSEFTRAAVPDYVFRELDCVRVKGKDRPVKIYEPIGPLGEGSVQDLEELTLYEEALQLYRTQNWKLSQEKFIRLKICNPERDLYDLYIKRIAYFEENKPASDWDGSFTFLTK